MNTIIANIYGTNGFEKTASAESGLPEDLYELATLVAVQQEGEGDIEKVASVQENYYGQLLAYDRAGRSLAHQEFADMEKEASAGNTEPIEAFFSDMIQEEQVSANPEAEAILAELERRRSV